MIVWTDELSTAQDRWWPEVNIEWVITQCAVCGKQQFVRVEDSSEQYCSVNCWMLGEIVGYDDAVELARVEYSIRQCELWSWMNPGMMKQLWVRKW